MMDKNDFIKQKLEYEKMYDVQYENNVITKAERDLAVEAISLASQVFNVFYSLKGRIENLDKTRVYDSPLEYAFDYFRDRFLNKIPFATKVESSTDKFTLNKYIEGIIPINQAEEEGLCHALANGETVNGVKVRATEGLFYKNMFTLLLNLKVDYQALTLKDDKTDVKKFFEAYYNFTKDVLSDNVEKDKNIIGEKDVLTYLEKLPLIEGDFSKTFTISTEVDQIVEWSPTSIEPSQEGFSFGTVKIDGEEIEVANFTFSNTKEAKESLIEAIKEAIESPEYADKVETLLNNIFSGIYIISKEYGYNLPQERSYDYHHLQIAKTVFDKELFMNFANQYIESLKEDSEKYGNIIKERDSLENPIEPDENTDTNVEENYDYDDVEQ